MTSHNLLSKYMLCKHKFYEELLEAEAMKHMKEWSIYLLLIEKW